MVLGRILVFCGLETEVFFWVFSVGVIDVVGVCYGCCGFVSWGLFGWCCG